LLLSSLLSSLLFIKYSPLPRTRNQLDVVAPRRISGSTIFGRIYQVCNALPEGRTKEFQLVSFVLCKKISHIVLAIDLPYIGNRGL
jgi:hypothetical protein